MLIASFSGNSYGSTDRGFYHAVAKVTPNSRILNAPTPHQRAKLIGADDELRMECNGGILRIGEVERYAAAPVACVASHGGVGGDAEMELISSAGLGMD